MIFLFKIFYILFILALEQFEVRHWIPTLKHLLIDAFAEDTVYFDLGLLLQLKSYVTCCHNTPQKWRALNNDFSGLKLFEVIFKISTSNNSLTTSDFCQGWIYKIDLRFRNNIPTLLIAHLVVVRSFTMSHEGDQMVLLGIYTHFREHAVDVLVQIIVDLLLLLHLLTVWSTSLYFLLGLLWLSALIDANVCEVVHILGKGGKTWEICQKHISIRSLVFPSRLRLRGTFVQEFVFYICFSLILLHVTNCRCLI